MSTHQSFNYTNKIKSELNVLFNQKLSLFRESISMVVTGSLGKGHLTPGSDIDLLVIIYDSDSHVTKEVVRKIKHIHFVHQFELYPIITLRQWKKITRDSALLCSDLFFAQPIWGKIDLFHSLKDYIKKNDLELRNRFSYFVYNLLYRDAQQKKYRYSDDLKYQPGGLRDLQFFLWVAKRLGTDPLNRPIDFVRSLLSVGFINRSEAKLLHTYTHALLDYKWKIESSHTMGLITSKICLDKVRSSIIPLVEKVKNKVLSEFEKSKGQTWIQYVTAARRKTLDAKTRWQLVKSQDETLIFCGLWSTKDRELIKYCLENYSYWTIRSAIALNTHTTNAQLNKLYRQNLPDMGDIRKFIKTNPNYRP